MSENPQPHAHILADEHRRFWPDGCGIAGCDVCASVGKSPAGRKDDQDKLQWHLMPMHGLCNIVKVLMFGAKKYAPENWRKVEGWRERYFDAAIRHLIAWRGGEKADPESGLHHL